MMIALILVTAPNVILWFSRYFYFGLIPAMASNAFPDCLSSLSVPVLYLKDHQIGNDTIYPELLQTVGVIRLNKVAWVLATQRQELSVNN